MMKRFGWLILAGAVLAGCTGGSKTAGVTPPPNNATTGTTGSNPLVETPTGEASKPNDATNPGLVPGSKPLDQPNAVMPSAKPDKNGIGTTEPKPIGDVKVPPVIINEKDPKWKKTPETPAELAQKMDEALANLKNAKVMAQVSYNVPAVGKLSGKTTVKIEDKDTFSVEYYMPGTSGNQNLMVSDDGKTAYMRDGRWVGKKPNIKINANSAEGTRAFEERFSEEMYSRFLANRDCWGPIIDAWQSGKGGYKLTMQQTSATNEKTKEKKPFYRLLATRGGDSKAQVEVRVDGTRYLPVAIRVIRTNKDGTKEDLFWNAAWGFGGIFTEKDFPVPNVKS